MSSNDAKRFREEQRKMAEKRARDLKVIPGGAYEEPTRTRSSKSSSSKSENGRSGKSVYKAPVGSAYKANNKKKKRRNPKLKILAILLAASIGVGGLTIAGNISNSANRTDIIQTIEQLEEQGIELSDLGLEDDTLELLEKYDDYFTRYNAGEITNITDNDVLEVISELRTLNFNVIKDKFVSEERENGDDEINRSDVKLGVSFDKSDGTDTTSVRIYEDQYSKRKIYTNNNGIIFGLGKQNSIPTEISDLILQTQKYDDIKEAVIGDNISKKNAMKKLEDYYYNIFNFAQQDIEIDEKGNVSLRAYGEDAENEKAEDDGIEIE